MPTNAWAPPLLAVQLLTRLPVPLLDRLDLNAARAAMARALAWLPLVGAGIGAVTAATFLAALHLWPPPVAAGVALAVEALLTGAFHEDAVADFCDAFGGGATGDEARRIMKDSRIGSYGALGLILLVGLRWAGTAALPVPLAAAAIVAAATIGRGTAVALMRLAPPGAGEGGLAAAIGTPGGATLLTALALALPGVAPLALTAPRVLAVGLAVTAVGTLWLARAVRARIGGSTGDCLGFAAYLGQVAALLTAAAA